MKRKTNRRGRRVDATGRSIGGDGHHARLYRWELQSAAYRSLSVGARALLVELKGLYNGRNNGELFLSVREAARRLGCGKNRATKLFGELVERGFVRSNEVGAFNMKAVSGRGKATSWILTEYPVGNATTGSKDFMRWQPTSTTPVENIPRSPLEGQPVPVAGTVSLKMRSTVPTKGTVLQVRGVKRSLSRGHR